MPVSCTDCVPASSTIVSVPVAGPLTAGWKTIISTQSKLGGSEVVLQEFVASWNGPLTVRIVIKTAVPPVFATATGNGAEGVPTSSCPKSTLAGLNRTAPAVTPVPKRLTVIDPPCTFAVMVICPVRAPPCVGENTTWIEQLAPGAIDACAQLSVSPKSASTVTDAGVSASVPVFVNVTVCAGLIVPTVCVSNERVVGLAFAVVTVHALVRRGVCHMPRP